MILAVDIGNSNTVMGFYRDGDWVDTWRVLTIKDQGAMHYYDLELRTLMLDADFNIGEVEYIILSSVVPVLRELFVDLLPRLFDREVTIVGPDLYKELDFAVPRPYEIGTDLVSNSYSAYTSFGKDCVVVDFGTALTFTTVSQKGYVQGVAIAPGIKTAMRALSSNTAQLPEIPLELPNSVLGQNTTHAMQAGILWGYVGMVRELLSKIREEVGEHYIAVATGGLSFVMTPLQDLFYKIDVNLTLNGLVHMMNDIIEKRTKQ